MLAAGVEKLLCVFNAAVAGKAEVAYLAQFLLPNEEINNAELPVEIVFDGGFVNVVHKVEVEVLNAAFFELVGKDRRGVRSLGLIVDLVTGVFVGEIELIPRMPRQSPADGDLGAAAVVGVSGVKVVYAVLDGVVGHFIDLGLIDVGLSAAGEEGQAHGAEAQHGELFALKITIYHNCTLFKTAYPLKRRYRPRPW